MAIRGRRGERDWEIGREMKGGGSRKDMKRGRGILWKEERGRKGGVRQREGIGNKERERGKVVFLGQICSAFPSLPQFTHHEAVASQ